MEKYNHIKIQTGIERRRERRIKRRRRRQVRLFAVSAPLLVAFLFFGWNAFAPPSNTNGGGALPAVTGTPGNSESPDVTLPQATQGEADDWNLILVNPWNYLPEGYDITLTQLKNGHAVDERCYPSLQEMMDDCRAAGLSPVICSSFRSMEKQEQLFDNKVNSFLAKGYSQEAARAEAGKVVAVPGTSEHQLGLAVDIVDRNNQNLDASQETTDVQQWLMQNSWRYGFILRYPTDKSTLTGIMYEPWHYRYVGKEAAKYIYENNICLEEYLDLI